MAKDKKSFVLYADLIKSIEHLTYEEKGILLTHLLEYVNDMNPVLTDRLILTAWKPIELQLKRDLKKFEEVKKKRSIAGKRSAELRALKINEQSEANSTSVESVEQTPTNPTDNDNDNDNVTVNDNVINNNTPSAFSFYYELLKLGAEKQLVSDWLAVRRRKKLTNTETALKGFLKQVDKSGNTLNDVLTKCIEKSWGGFEAEWFEKEKRTEDKIDFEKLKDFISQKTGRNFPVIHKEVKEKYLARLKEGYTKQDILDAVSNAVKSDFHKEENFKFLTPEFFSRSETLDKYSNVNNKPKENNVKSLIPKGVTYSGPQY